MSLNYILAGATGLVGSELLRQITAGDTNAKVFCIGRSAPPVENKSVIFIAHDFSGAIDWQKNKPQNAVALCVLGTTIKKAGSQEAFHKVDFDFVLNFAEETARAGATALHVVTAHGASAHSSIFYNRVKGAIEEKLQSLQLPSLHIYRPSILLGERNERRTGESIAASAVKFLAPIFKLPGLANVQPTPAAHLAAYILRVAQDAAPGNHIHSNAEIMR
ncbi:MAG: hypothetical protein LDLANPLL_02559 [Turneriella sp.]|nr:hypothetical protein [Turneriella sp.]